MKARPGASLPSLRPRSRLWPYIHPLPFSHNGALSALVHAFLRVSRSHRESANEMFTLIAWLVARNPVPAITATKIYLDVPKNKPPTRVSYHGAELFKNCVYVIWVIDFNGEQIPNFGGCRLKCSIPISTPNTCNKSDSLTVERVDTFSQIIHIKANGIISPFTVEYTQYIISKTLLSQIIFIYKTIFKTVL